MNIKKKSIINYVLISLLSLILFIPCIGYNTIKADEEVETNDVEQVVEVEETQEEVVLEQETIVEQEQLELEELPVETADNSVVLEPVEDEQVLNALPITINTKVNSAIDFELTTDQTANVKFNVPSSGFMTINLVLNEGSSYTTRFALVDSNNYTCFSGSMANSNTSYGYYLAGNYTYKVETTTAARKSQKYTLGIEFESGKETSDIVESLKKTNDIKSDAFTVKLNKLYKAGLGRNDETDWYKFDLTDKWTVPHFTIDGRGLYTNNSIQGRYKIYDSYSKELKSGWLGNEVTDFDLDQELPKGTYYLQINRHKQTVAGTYTVKIMKIFNGWKQNKYWYENGVRQGVYGDPKNVKDAKFGNKERGREIFDPVSNGWYWLDANAEGAKAVSKEVWMPYIFQNESEWTDKQIEEVASASGTMAPQVVKAIKNKDGKWVRYNESGKMYKGWIELKNWKEKPEQNGNTYYYDQMTGLMAKGETVVDGKTYYFDPISGVLR